MTKRVKKLYKVTIDRSKWRTGDEGPYATGKGPTQLRNIRGYKCCLGFICRVIKPSVKITECSYPYTTGCDIPELTVRKLYFTTGEQPLNHTNLSRKAAAINDDEEMTLRQKEKALKALFKDSPIALEFVGEPTPYHRQSKKGTGK
jgi:hypothetical protein